MWINKEFIRTYEFSIKILRNMIKSNMINRKSYEYADIMKYEIL